jgi:hypothetical protein
MNMKLLEHPLKLSVVHGDFAITLLLWQMGALFEYLQLVLVLLEKRLQTHRL